MQPLVQRDRERELIRARIGDAGVEELRSHVAGRAGERWVVAGRDEPEVSDAGPAIRADDHVLGLEVAMDQASAMRRFEATPGAFEHRDDLAPAPFPAATQPRKVAPSTSSIAM